MGATWSFTTTFVAGNVLTAAQLNTLQSDVTVNFLPSGMDDQSSNVTAMRATADPYPASSASLATDLTGEIHRLRYSLAQITGETYWYQDPSGGSLSALTPASITLAGSAWPSFSVHKNGTDQLDITGTQKITWDGANADFDTNSDFDDANDRFTPAVAGKYLLTCFLTWVPATLGANDIATIYVYKNNAETHSKSHKFYSNQGGLDITVVVDANGSTDYFEIFASVDARNSADIEGTATQTKFMGSRIA